MSYFSKKKLPPLPLIFQLMWGVLPTLPPSETASAYSIDYVSDANADYVSDVNADYVSDANASVSAPPPSPFNLPQSPSPLAYSPYTKVQMLFKQT